MADERCVFPGDGSRPPGGWLDRDTAERLLRGEPLETADAGIRARADRLAGALDALTVTAAGTSPADSELPGEKGALAAFRAARAGPDTEPAERAGWTGWTGRVEPTGQHGHSGWAEQAGRTSRGPHPHARTDTMALTRTPAPDTSLDAGLVRLGRPGQDRRAPSLRGRPVRYGLAAALAAGMIGGVATAATTGVLAFGGEKPEPGASVTAAVTPDRPLRTPSPGESRGDDPRPEGTAGAPTAGGAAPSAGTDGDADADADTDTGTGTGTQPGSEDPGRTGRPGQRWAVLVSACRDHRDGKDLDAERRRALEDAAHGAGQVKKYCKGLLKSWDREDSGDDRNGPGSGHGRQGGNANGGNGDGDGRDGSAGGDDGGDGKDRGDDRGRTGPGTFKGDRGDRDGQDGRSDRGGQDGVTFSAVPTQ